jgi:hypothetical protein
MLTALALGLEDVIRHFENEVTFPKAEKLKLYYFGSAEFLHPNNFEDERAAGLFVELGVHDNHSRSLRYSDSTSDC